MHVGKLREVREKLEKLEKLRDKCPTSYGKRLLSLNFPNKMEIRSYETTEIINKH